MDLAPRSSIDTALHALTQEGKIRRLARGIYDYPKESKMLGTLLPSTEVIAKALARTGVQRLQPAGAYAANLLGLSEQVPARTVYFTDGPSRKVKIGAQIIHLKQVTPRNIKLHDRLSGLVVQALRYIGQRNVGIKQIETLRSRLSLEEQKKIADDAQWAPAWIAKIMRELPEKQ